MAQGIAMNEGQKRPCEGVVLNDIGHRSFTLVECLLVVALIAGLLALTTAAYRRAKWTAKVTQHAIENRQRLNKAVGDGKFKRQKRFNEELDRLKRQTDIGLRQGK